MNAPRKLPRQMRENYFKFKNMAEGKDERREFHTQESVLEEFMFAFNEWQTLPENERHDFNTEWLRLNGHSKIYSWIKEHGGFIEFIKILPENVQNNFLYRQKKELRYTDSIAIDSLREAYQKWDENKDPHNPDFSLFWLENHGYRGLAQWIEKYPNGVEIFLQNLPQDLRGKLAYTPNFNRDKAILNLFQAYGKWFREDPIKRKPFSLRWLKENGYSGLSQWISKHYAYNVSAFIAFAPRDVKESFIYEPPPESYTESSALEKFYLAFKKWQDLSAVQGKRFNVRWLKNNGYEGLYQWIKKHGGIENFVHNLPNHIQHEFSYMKKRI